MNEQEKRYHLMRMNGMTPCGLPCPEPQPEPAPAQCHCDSPGLTMEGATVVEIHNAHGQHYFKATAEIGTIFGSEVEGQCEGIGATREQALERLQQDIKNLHESLWV